MDNWYIYLLIAAVIIFVVFKEFVDKLEKGNKTESKYSYKSRINLLTNAEMNFYRKLLIEFPSDQYFVFSKVRLADIVESIEKGKGGTASFNKIKSKHVDFVVTDKNSKIVKVIELDDYTHKWESRKTRDAFVDSVMADAGIAIEHR